MHKMMAFFVILFMISFTNQKNVSAAVLFTDDFSGVTSGAWGNESGNWYVHDGVYDAMSPDNNPLAYSSLTNFTNLNDFSLDVDVNAANDLGVMLRSSYVEGLGTTGVELVIGGMGGTYNGLYWHEIHNVVNAEILQILNPVYVPGLQGSDLRVRVDVVGDTYSAFVNDALTPTTTWTTGSFSSGSVGLVDVSTRASFDSVVLSDFNNASSPVPEPSTMFLLGTGLVGLLRLKRKK